MNVLVAAKDRDCDVLINSALPIRGWLITVMGEGVEGGGVLRAVGREGVVWR